MRTRNLLYRWMITRALKKLVIFGNSASGKSTLARDICRSENLAHLDLDTLAWKPGSPPERKPLAESMSEIGVFLASHAGWVIEGCYADLVKEVLPEANEVIFLDLPVEDCIANAKRRPWEPHKYESKEAQDKNLEMLIEWISMYPERDGEFSRAAHISLYETFTGQKTLFTTNDRRTCSRP